jgi:hypothetical protein
MALPAGATSNTSNLTYGYTSTPSGIYGEYLGQNCSVDAGTGAITNASASIAGGGVLTVSFTQTTVACGTVPWSITVAAPAGQKLDVGTYSFARYPFNGTSWGLAVQADDRLCNADHGTVTIKWLHTDHRVLDLYGADVVFDNYCDNIPALLHGEVVFGTP